MAHNWSEESRKKNGEIARRAHAEGKYEHLKSPEIKLKRVQSWRRFYSQNPELYEKVKNHLKQMQLLHTNKVNDFVKGLDSTTNAKVVYADLKGYKRPDVIYLLGKILVGIDLKVNSEPEIDFAIEVA